jgi:branched-subunit amino acid aminotransferase/4-amino-4-deoxychorismate lyase
MRRSAQALRLPLDPASLPDVQAVTELLRANQIAGDARLRITLSGGLSPAQGSTCWMRAGPLPERPETHRLLGFWTVALDDPLAQHKSLNYARRRLAHEQAEELGCQECLSRSPDGSIWEGSRTNLFWVLGSTLETPPRTGPIVPGVMRERVLELAGSLFPTVLECPADVERLTGADEVFLTNALRGIMPVESLAQLPALESENAAPEPLASWRAPGPKTAQLLEALTAWLMGGGDA